MTSPNPVLRVDGLAKSFGPKAVLRDVHFTADAGEFVCVVGPSGAGKTTLLRCAGGLLPPSHGEVLLAGAPVTEPPPGLAVVFQDYSRSLLPWMRVRDNVAFPLRSRRVPVAERRRRADAALLAVNLTGAGDLYPWQLSGGMQQRVAIARALAYEPEVLHMDEPFASVDAQTRAELEDLVLDVRRRTGVTFVLVTHDIDEAVYLADRVVVLSGIPATVTDTVHVDLGDDRDQVETKARHEFVELRTHVLRLIRAAGARSRATA